uniref:(northern house mosquito) hypothetical protein n=1 Tax=Culex pipiens TaxID=7175 RepID=A0A8D8MWL1_CULPI
MLRRRRQSDSPRHYRLRQMCCHRNQQVRLVYHQRQTSSSCRLQRLDRCRARSLLEMIRCCPQQGSPRHNQRRQMCCHCSQQKRRFCHRRLTSSSRRLQWPARSRSC